MRPQGEQDFCVESEAFQSPRCLAPQEARNPGKVEHLFFLGPLRSPVPWPLLPELSLFMAWAGRHGVSSGGLNGQEGLQGGWEGPQGGG